MSTERRDTLAERCRPIFDMLCQDYQGGEILFDPNKGSFRPSDGMYCGSEIAITVEGIPAGCCEDIDGVFTRFFDGWFYYNKGRRYVKTEDEQ